MTTTMMTKTTTYQLPSPLPSFEAAFLDTPVQCCPSVLCFHPPFPVNNAFQTHVCDARLWTTVKPAIFLGNGVATVNLAVRPSLVRPSVLASVEASVVASEHPS